MLRVQNRILLLLPLAASLFVQGCQKTAAPPSADLPALNEADFSPVILPAVKRAYAQVTAQPQSAEANGGLAMILHAAGKYEQGELFYRRALARERTFRWLYYLSQLQTLKGAKPEALQTLEQALTLDPRYVPALIKSARLLLDAGRPAEAQAMLTQKVQPLAPDSPVVAFELGRVAQALGQKPVAIAHWERACTLLPEYGAAQYALAQAYRAAGKTAEAKARLALYELHKNKQPAQSDPLEAAFMAYVNGGGQPQNQTAVTGSTDQANAALERGDLPRAAREYQAILAREPGNAPVRSSLIAVHYKLREFDLAAARYAEALRLHPQYADAHYHYGMALLAQGRSAEAGAAFAKALASQPTHAAALTQAGLLREKAGDDAAAIDFYGKALANDPKQRQATFLMGRQLVRQKKYGEGIAHLEKTLTPDDEQTPWFLRALAGAHNEAGHTAQALDYFTQARAKAAVRNDTRILPLLDQDIAALKARGGR